MTDFKDIRLEVDGPIAQLVLNRPERLNSFSPDMIAELRTATEALQTRRDIRCLIIRAEGRGFCAGADLTARRYVAEGGSVDLQDSVTNGVNHLAMALRTMPFPTISAVQGVAAGAGASLALSADICVASDNARFLMAFSSIGLVPDTGATWLLPQTVGRAQALAKMLLGEGWTAAEALERGMIYRVVAPDELNSVVAELAATLAKRPTLALVAGRKLIDAAQTNALSAQLAAEAEAQGHCGNSEDYRRGLRAFFNKETAAFEGN